MAAYELTGDTGLLYNIAQSYRQAGEGPRALFYYQKAKEMFPADSALNA